jgi:hypothetical protein
VVATKRQTFLEVTVTIIHLQNIYKRTYIRVGTVDIFDFCRSVAHRKTEVM